MPVQQLLGEMVAAACLMQANIKFNGALILQIFGDGPVKLAVAEVQPDLALRATACSNDSETRTAITAVVSALDTCLSGVAPLAALLPQLGITERAIDACVKVIRQVCEP